MSGFTLSMKLCHSLKIWTVDGWKSVMESDEGVGKRKSDPSGLIASYVLNIGVSRVSSSEEPCRSFSASRNWEVQS